MKSNKIKLAGAKRRSEKKLHADSAAYIKGGSDRLKAISNAKDIRSKIDNAYGYTGKAKLHAGRAESYAESAKRARDSGNVKAAISTKAASKNNSTIASNYKSAAKSKNWLTRNSVTKKTIRNSTFYSPAGRAYVLKNERIKNMLTGNLYSTVKDAEYKRQYTAEERYARIK